MLNFVKTTKTKHPCTKNCISIWSGTISWSNCTRGCNNPILPQEMMENDTGLLQALLGNFPFYPALDGAESNQLLCHLAPDQCPVQRSETALKTIPHLNMAKLSHKKMHMELYFFSLYKYISLRDNVHWRNRSQQHVTSHPFCTYWMFSSVRPVTILHINFTT